MGYRIQYGKTVNKVHIKELVKKKKSPIRIITVLTACFVSMFIFLENSNKILDAVIPGNKTVTKAAFSTFVDDLRGGETVTDAFADFCREIVENAKTSS